MDVHRWNVSGVCLGRESTDALSFTSAAEGSSVVEETSQVMSAAEFIFLPACSDFSFRVSGVFDA